MQKSNVELTENYCCCFLLLCQKYFKALLCLMSSKNSTAWWLGYMGLGWESYDFRNEWHGMKSSAWSSVKYRLDPVCPVVLATILNIWLYWRGESSAFNLKNTFLYSTAKWVCRNFLLKLLDGFHLKNGQNICEIWYRK